MFHEAAEAIKVGTITAPDADQLLGWQSCGRCRLPYPVEMLTATVGGRCLCPRCLGIVSQSLVSNTQHKLNRKGKSVKTLEQVVTAV